MLNVRYGFQKDCKASGTGGGGHNGFCRVVLKRFAVG